MARRCDNGDSFMSLRTTEYGLNRITGGNEDSRGESLHAAEESGGWREKLLGDVGEEGVCEGRKSEGNWRHANDEKAGNFVLQNDYMGKDAKSDKKRNGRNGRRNGETTEDSLSRSLGDDG